MDKSIDMASMNVTVQFVWKYEIPVLIISSITLIVYLIYIKKYFKRS